MCAEIMLSFVDCASVRIRKRRLPAVNLIAVDRRVMSEDRRPFNPYSVLYEVSNFISVNKSYV